MPQVTIDTLGGLGDGIARLNGKPIFIPKSCAGDVVTVRILSETKEAIRAEIAEIHHAGDTRISPSCIHYDSCGGCSLQHLNDHAYKSFKQGVLGNALAHAGFAGTQVYIVFLPAATRRRVEFKIKHVDKKLTLAYHGLRSHNLTAIETCPILLPQLQSLLPLLTSALQKLPGSSSFTSVNLTAADSGIDVLLSLTGNADALVEPLKKICESLNLARISVRAGESKLRVIHETIPVEMRLGNYTISLPPEAFLQAASEAQTELTNFVLKHISQSRHVVDLFCGIGTYSFPAISRAHVHAVDVHGETMRGMKHSIARHKLEKRISSAARDLFKQPLSAAELAAFDAAIVNPPRAGAKEQIKAIAESGLKRVVMISCNPASFARDAKALKAAGFTLDDAMGLDQFVWSPHLEIAASFSR